MVQGSLPAQFAVYHTQRRCVVVTNSHASCLVALSSLAPGPKNAFHVFGSSERISKGSHTCLPLLDGVPDRTGPSAHFERALFGKDVDHHHQASTVTFTPLGTLGLRIFEYPPLIYFSFYTTIASHHLALPFK